MFEDNKALVRRLLEEGFNEGNLAVADQVLADDFLDHNPLPGLPPTAEGFKQSFAAMPDMQYTIEDLLADDDRVVVRWTATGTHTGEMFGMPVAGKWATVTGMDLFRVQAGKNPDHRHRPGRGRAAALGDRRGQEVR